MIRVFCFAALILALPSLSLAGRGGNEVGNGGDLIECRVSAENKYNGLYTLDYLLTELPSNPSVKVATWKDSLFSIRHVLATKLPEMLSSFDQFSNQVFSSDISGTMVWEKTQLTLIDIDDEDIPKTVKIPANCRVENKVRLIQAIIRQKAAYSGASQVIFKYNPETIDLIKTERPLQLSYLLVHEWLWSLSDNVVRNRRLNHFIHQPEFYHQSRIELLSSFKNLGLNIPEIPVVVAADGTGHYTNLDLALQARPDAVVFQLKPGRYRVANLMITRPLQLIGLEGAAETMIEGPSNAPALIFSSHSGKSFLKGLTFLRTTSQSTRAIDAYQNAAIASESGAMRFENCIFGTTRFDLSKGFAFPGLYARDTSVELVKNFLGYAQPSPIYFEENVSGYSESSTMIAKPVGPSWTFIMRPESSKHFDIREPNMACDLGRLDGLVKCVPLLSSAF